MSDSEWPGLGFNPAKGSATAVEWLSHDVKRVGDELEELHRLIEKIGKDDRVWKGEAATAFRGQVGKLPTYLKQGSKSMHDCSRALRHWHDQLTVHQKRARTLENQAIAARGHVKETRESSEKINGQIDAANKNHVQMTQAEADRLTNQSRLAAAAVEKAAHELNRIIKEAEALRKEWERHAEDAAKAIRDAAKHHPPNFHVWEKISGGLKKAWKGFKNFLADHADLFSTISAGLAIAAIAVNVIPVIGQGASAVLIAGSSGFSAAAMAGHSIAAGRGDWKAGGKAGLDLLGVLPGGKAIWAMAKAPKGAATVFSQSTRLSRGIYGAYDGLTNTIGTRLVNRGLSKFDRPISPTLITLKIKGVSFAHGVSNQFSEEDRKATPYAFHGALAR
ncbi:putative T7SS-secreted protein [Streptomyces mobaraensis]|uniref:putative T7SS-secreted protein n=1 Tax=Streptomyces mobaraensis TaxID=35621 RepID=UPI00331D8935